MFVGIRARAIKTDMITMIFVPVLESRCTRSGRRNRCRGVMGRNGYQRAKFAKIKADCSLTLISMVSLHWHTSGGSKTYTKKAGTWYHRCRQIIEERGFEDLFHYGNFSMSLRCDCHTYFTKRYIALIVNNTYGNLVLSAFGSHIQPFFRGLKTVSIGRNLNQ